MQKVSSNNISGLALGRVYPMQTLELVYLSHEYGGDALLESISRESALYSLPGPGPEAVGSFRSQAEVALWALSNRFTGKRTSGDPSSERVPKLIGM